MPRSNDSGERLHALMNALAEEVAVASDQDIAMDMAADGGRLRDRAEHARSLLLGSVQQFKRDRLLAAEERHRKNTEAFQLTLRSLPTAPSARRAILNGVLGKKPEVLNMVAITMQHRNFQTLSDEDVESVLRQLQHLGVLDVADDNDEPDK